MSPCVDSASANRLTIMGEGRGVSCSRLRLLDTESGVVPSCREIWRTLAPSSHSLRSVLSAAAVHVNFIALGY